jgi:short-subunit dehydrogenase
MTKISKDTVAWITGASSGIGEALTYLLNEKGAKIIISSRRKEALEKVKSACKHPDHISILPLDLEDAASLPKKAREAESIHGHIDILFNNGGISQRETALHTALEVDRKIMEINYFSAIALSKAVLPRMLERGKGHHVITSSATGIISTPRRSAYAASKHALHGFYDALRAEHHADNIKVTLVCPGFIHTNISNNALKGDGNAYGVLDDAQAGGMSVDELAKRMIRAVEKGKDEVYIGGLREVTGIYLKRFIPSLYARIVRKVKVT